MSGGKLPAAICLTFVPWLCGDAHAQETQRVIPHVTGVTSPRDGYPDIAPDGEYIVFQSNRSGTWQLWIVKPDGAELQRLTRSGANDVTPVWSPDGRNIMFASDRSGGARRDFDPAESFDARDIYVMDVSGGFEKAEQTVTRIIADEADDMHPEWADAGRKVVFNRVYDTGDGADILIAGIDGSNVRVLDTDSGWNTYAAMTPDGKHLVYRGIVDEMHDGTAPENSDIFSAHPDGSNRARLTDDPSFDGWPAVSPDGKIIAFASSRSGEAYHIYLMPVSGGEPRQVTFGSQFNYTQPAWSADGTKLAAFRWNGDEAGEIGHIVLIELETDEPGSRPPSG